MKSFFSGTNFEACENAFIKVNKHKHSTNKMTWAKRLSFLLMLTDHLNYALEKKMEQSGKLTACGYAKGKNYFYVKDFLLNYSGWRDPLFDYKKLYEDLVLFKGDVATDCHPTVVPRGDAASDQSSFVLSSQFKLLRDS